MLFTSQPEYAGDASDRVPERQALAIAVRRRSLKRLRSRAAANLRQQLRAHPAVCRCSRQGRTSKSRLGELAERRAILLQQLRDADDHLMTAITVQDVPNEISASAAET